jgi:hypothetical protein
VLIESMSWTNSHLHEFKVNGIRHGDPAPGILNLFGDPRPTFGDPKFCTGPLPSVI